MLIVHLLAAIVAETVGTTALHASQQFSRPVPSILAVASYGLSIYLLSLTLKVLPVGVVYAVWSGLGSFPSRSSGWSRSGGGSIRRRCSASR